MVATDYERGLRIGEQAARLDNHDKQFDGIQDALGSLSDDVRDMGIDFRKLFSDLGLSVQALALNAKASADTAVALAEGVEKERVSNAAAILKEKTKDSEEIAVKWSPWPKVAMASTVSFGLVGSIYLLTH